MAVKPKKPKARSTRQAPQPQQPQPTTPSAEPTPGLVVQGGVVPGVSALNGPMMPMADSVQRMVELGSSGLRRAGNRVFDASLLELTGREGAKRFRQMAELNSVVGASLLIFKLLLRDVTFRVEPASEEDGDAPMATLEERAQFVDSALRDIDLTFDDVISNACTMFTYGYAFLEEVYKYRRGDNAPDDVDPVTQERTPGPTSHYDDGLVGWRTLALRAQETVEEWRWDRNNRAIGLVQRDPYARKAEAIIPLDKGLLFRTENVKGNPEGKSLLLPAYQSWKIVKRLQEIEAIGMSRNLNGVPLARVPLDVFTAQPGTAQAQTLEQVKQILFGMTVDEGAGFYLPSIRDSNGELEWDLELLSTSSKSSSGGADSSKVISRYEHRIATALLTAFMLLGQDQVGTQALAENNSDMLLACINGIAGALADVFTQQAFPRLMRANGWPASQAPKLVHEKVRRAPSLADLGTYLSALTGMGVQLVPDATVENNLRARADLPPLAMGEDGEPIRPEPPEPDPALLPPEDPEDPEGEGQGGGKPPARKPAPVQQGARRPAPSRPAKPSPERSRRSGSEL